MKHSLNNLHANLNDISALLDLSLTLTSVEQRKVIFRSAVVLLIASWEQYIEQLAESAITVLANRLRDSSTLPENVKQSIALSTISEKRNNQREFSDSVWLFADKGWKSAYTKYCKNLTSNLNTASSNNIKDLYWNVLGIRNITHEWGFKKLTSEQCAHRLSDLVELRHDIAHGANQRANELMKERIQEHTEFIFSLANNTYRTVFNRTAGLSQTQALVYSLCNKYFTDIILSASTKASGILTLTEIKKLGSSAQGNHNKLCYEPWSLLEFVNKSKRRITEKLLKFCNNEISLPLEILVFDNNEAIAKPGTRNIKFSELQHPRENREKN